MRRLAADLGVAPNTLYSYYPSKDELLDAVLDSLLADIRTDDFDTETPREQIIEIMVDSRRVLLQNADFLPQLLSRPMRGSNVSRLAETTLRLLSDLGLEGQAAVDALRVVLTYLFGSAAMDAPRAQEEDPARRQATAEAAFRQRPDLPHVTTNAQALARPPEAILFRRGLQWLLNGILATDQPAP